MEPFLWTVVALLVAAPVLGFAARRIGRGWLARSVMIAAGLSPMIAWLVMAGNERIRYHDGLLDWTLRHGDEGIILGLVLAATMMPFAAGAAVVGYFVAGRQDRNASRRGRATADRGT